MAVLGLSAVSDINSNKIPNKLIKAGLILSFIFQDYSNGFLPGITFVVIRVLLVFLILFPLFLLKKLGAGDIKLLCLIGAYTSVKTALFTFALGMYAAIVPVLMALFKHKSVKDMVIPMAPCFFLGFMLLLVTQCLV